MKVFASYSWSGSEGSGFGNITATDVSPPPNTLKGVENLRELAKRGHREDATIIILFWHELEG